MMLRNIVVAILAVSVLAAADRPARAADVSDVKKTLDGSLAKVSFFLKYDEGESPGRESGGGCAALWRLAGQLGAQSSGYDVDRRQPLVTGGFVIATDTVLVEDPMVEDRFIDHIEVQIGAAKYTAVIDAMALDNRALFLKLSTRAANARPITFDSKASPPYSAVTYAQGTDGVWGLQFVPVTADAGITDEGAKPLRVPSPALMVSAKGKIAGAAFADSLSSSGEWRSSPALWKKITAADFQAQADRTVKASGEGIVQVTLKFRIRQSRRWDDSSYWEQRETPTEKDVPGLLLGGGKVLLLTGMSRRQTATVESAAIVVGETNVPLAIQGALVTYAALLASYEGDPPGLTSLPRSKVDFARVLDRLLIADDVSYDNGARDEHVARGRVQSVYFGPLGLLWPQGRGSGEFLFSLDGSLIAVPLGLRKQVEMTEYYSAEDAQGYGDAVLMPAERLAAFAAEAGSVDASWRPMSEEDARKFAWLGLETQEITKDLARAKNAAIATKGGEIGAVVSHVYKGSPAEKAEVKAGDVLVRFVVAGQVKPVDVKMRDRNDNDFPWAELDQVPDTYFDQIPRPWPAQNNALARALTEVGIGRTIQAEFIRDGRTRFVDFVLEYGPPDFNSAASFEDKASGLTVKDMTYEVRRYFKMKDDDPGVVVSGIKKGSKASVGGVKPCEIITAVNGRTVSGIEDFKAAISVGGEVSLTVKRMSQTRVVKLKLSAASQEKKSEADAQPPTPSAGTPEEPGEGSGQAETPAAGSSESVLAPGTAEGAGEEVEPAE